MPRYDELNDRRYYVPNDQGHEAVIAARMAERDTARQDKPRRKKRSDPPMAGMSDAMGPREAERKRIAETEKRDASG